MRKLLILLMLVLPSGHWGSAPAALAAQPASRPATTRPASTRPAISEEARARLVYLLGEKKDLELKLRRLRAGKIESGYWGHDGYELVRRRGVTGFVFQSKKIRDGAIERTQNEIKAIQDELVEIRRGTWQPPPPPPPAKPLTAQEQEFARAVAQHRIMVGMTFKQAQDAFSVAPRETTTVPGGPRKYRFEFYLERRPSSTGRGELPILLGYVEVSVLDDKVIDVYDTR